MFKNARTRLVEGGRLGPDTARSYQIECLLYNVPNPLLAGSYRLSYSSALYWLSYHDLTRLPSQDNQFLMFDRGWPAPSLPSGRPDGFQANTALPHFDGLDQEEHSEPSRRPRNGPQQQFRDILCIQGLVE